MTTPWSCDRHLDATRVRALLQSRFPQLGDKDVRYLAEGWDSEVFEVDGDLLFRFPKRVECEADYKVEINLLPALARHFAAAGVDVRIPHFDFVGEAGPLFPYKWVGYGKLLGDQASDVALGDVPVAQVAAQLGRALTAVHAFPAPEALRLGVPASMASRGLAEMKKRALAKIPEVTQALGGDLPDRVQAAIEASTLPEYEGAQVLVHNDLLSEHILLDPRTREVTGIIDWSDTALGDPAVDFVGIEMWGGRALTRQTMAHYGGAMDATFEDRITLRALCVGVYCAYFGVMKKNVEDVEWSRAALELGLKG